MPELEKYMETLTAKVSKIDSMVEALDDKVQSSPKLDELKT